MEIKNDAKCAALAEKNFGAMKEYDDCVFLTIGTGIGGAAFFNGEMLVPKRFSGLEFGHMVICKGGRQCTCGKKGCFETYASIKSFKTKIAECLGIDSDFSGKYLRDNLLNQNDDRIDEVIEQYTTDLAVGICNLIDIFEPEIVVLGGSFSYYENTKVYSKLLEKIEAKDSRFNKIAVPKIAMAKLQNDAGMIGAIIRS